MPNDIYIYISYGVLNIVEWYKYNRCVWFLLIWKCNYFNKFPAPIWVRSLPSNSLTPFPVTVLEHSLQSHWSPYCSWPQIYDGSISPFSEVPDYKSLIWEVISGYFPYSNKPKLHSLCLLYFFDFNCNTISNVDHSIYIVHFICLNPWIAVYRAVYEHSFITVVYKPSMATWQIEEYILGSIFQYSFKG